MKFIAILIVIFVIVVAAFAYVGAMLNERNSADSKGISTSLADLFSGNKDDKNDETSAEEDAYDWHLRHVLVIGDSLTVSATKEIEAAIPGSSVDGKVSRGMTEGVKIFRDWVAGGLVGDDDILVIALANNIGGSTLDSLDSLLEDIGPKQSLILMTGHGRENMKPVNEYIRTLPNEYPFIVVADWDEAIASNSSWLSGDGIHISNNKGKKLYADLIVDALEKTAPRS